MKRITEQLTAWTARHRTGCLILLVVLGLLAGSGLPHIRFTNDVSQLFPDSQDAGVTFRILNETRLGNTVQLEFISPDPVEKHEKYLDSVVEKLVRQPGVKHLVFRYRTADPVRELAAFSALIPRFFPPEILTECKVETAIQNALKQLIFPVPGNIRLLRSQPFGLERNILKRLQQLDEMTGMKLAPDLPYFASQDKRRAMIVFDVDIMIGDADAVRKLTRQLRTAVEPLPAGMRCRIISGCMHTLGNEEVLKRDAAIAGSVSLVLFLLIFLIFYRRDWRALWIPVIPLYASLLALGTMTLFFREICLYVIGLGSCITGLAIDQGIHVYAAFRGKEAERKTAALTEPMMLSAGTSILVFVFLALTGIRAYIQLAVFAGLSLAFSTLAALIVLPLLLNRERRIAELKLTLPDWTIPVCPLLFLLFPAAVLCGKVVLRNSDFSLESLDGTPEAIRIQEQDFNSAWRTPGLKTAVLAASAKTGEEALSRLQRITERLRQNHIPAAGPPQPPEQEQIANRNRWRTPETRVRIDSLEKEVRTACRAHRLPENFFQPFFDQLHRAIASEDLSLPPLLQTIARKMIKEHSRQASATALLPDTASHAGIVKKILQEHGRGHCALLSKEGFRLLIREELGGRFLWLLPISLFAALLLAYGVFRKITDVLLAMVPVFVSFCGLLLLGAATGFRATPAAAFALILLTGLAVDYGIYAVSQLRHPEELSVRGPVLLSAATTVAGAGSLMFSKHPALFGTGTVLAAGIALACLSGLYLVPLLRKRKTPPILLPLILILLLFLPTGCISGTRFADHPAAEQLRQGMKLYPDTPFQIQADAVLKIQNREHSFILAAEFNPASGEMKAAGISGAGTLLFRLNERDALPGSGMPENAKKPLNALREDLCRIFLLKKEKPLAVEQKAEYIVAAADDGTTWEFHSDGLIRKKGSGPFRAWDCEYRNSARTILYRNHRRNYILRLRIMKLAEKGKSND